MPTGRIRRFGPHGAGGPPIREIPLRLFLPNLITVVAICAGLSAIRMAIEARFETAVTLLLIAAFLDGIDGRIARMLKATTKFGAQMDSLADVINFGVAPALVLYVYLLDQARSAGWIAALLFAIACGLRLARFNVLDEDTERPAWQSEYFVGVPAPAGAVVVLLPIYLVLAGVVTIGPQAAFFGAVYTILIAFLLVSRLPVYSGKRIRIARENVTLVLLGVVFVMLLLFTYPWQTLTISVALYLVSLPLSALAYSRRATREAELAASQVQETAGAGGSSSEGTGTP